MGMEVNRSLNFGHLPKPSSVTTSMDSSLLPIPRKSIPISRVDVTNTMSLLPTPVPNASRRKHRLRRMRQFVSDEEIVALTGHSIAELERAENETEDEVAQRLSDEDAWRRPSQRKKSLKGRKTK